MTATALVISLGLAVIAVNMYQRSVILGLAITIIAAFVIYLSLPILLLMRRLPIGRRLPRLALLFWLAIFNFFNLSTGTLVYLNNRGTGRIKSKREDIHVMVSRCLQWSECKQNVIRDIANCEECGKCKIGAVKVLCASQQVSASVESGGTAARLRLKQKKPKLVMAVACERELLAGVLDAPLPVVGVTLRVGPEACSDSDVQLPELEQRLNYAIKEG